MFLHLCKALNRAFVNVGEFGEVGMFLPIVNLAGVDFFSFGFLTFFEMLSSLWNVSNL